MTSRSPAAVTEKLTVDESKWLLVLKTHDQRHGALVALSPEAKPMVDLVRVALINIVKLCHASSKLHWDDEHGIKVTEKPSVYNLDGRGPFQVPLECYTSTQPCTLNSLQFGTKLDSRNTPRLPALSLNHPVNRTCFQRPQRKHRLCRRRYSPAEEEALLR